jgi:hypothetical protein
MEFRPSRTQTSSHNDDFGSEIMRRRLIAACALALCGCASPIKSGFVSEQWTTNMEELGIYPVFPPREDIYVGDIYVTYGAADAAAPTASATPSAGSPRPKLPTLGVYFARLDVAQKLKAQYAARPEFGGAPVTPSSIFDGPAAQTRLKTVAFPYFFSATATGAEIGAFVPVDGLPLKAGLGLDSIKSASVTVSAAESYALPWSDLAEEVFDDDGKLFVRGRFNAAKSLARARQLADFASENAAPLFVDITVISEVFYARSFDVTFHLANDVAASVGVSLPAIPGAPAADVAASSAVDATATSTKAKMASANAATAAVAASAPSAIQASDVAAAVKAQADAAQAKAEGLAPSSPGVKVGFVKSQGGDVGLRSTYDHAIAIGYRGVRYRMNLATGVVATTAVNHGETLSGTGAAPGPHEPASAAH